nr:transporter substrate-binding domain-containing protein [uncultured Aminipila sp.]
MKKFFSIMVVILLSMTVLAGCGDNADKEKVKTKAKPLVVAMDLTQPPFEMKDEKGNPTGVSVDFVKAFGEYIGRDVKIENTSYDGLISSLQEGKADMVISSMSITDEASQTVDFSEPYADIMLAVLVNKNSGISSAESLNQEGKKIVVIADSAGYIYAQKNLTNTEIITLADENACVSEVTQGKADAFICDQLSIYRDWYNYTDKTTMISIGGQEAERWGVAVQKGNTELLAQINEFIGTYRVNGGFNKLTSRYLSEEKTTFDKLGVKWIFDID